MNKKHITLTKEDRDELESLVKNGKVPTRVYRRAVALLELDQGKTLTAVANTLGVSVSSVGTWRDKYRETGLTCLHDAPRPGRPIGISGEERAKITALACSEPPEGYAKWTLRLLADKAVELELCEHISHTQVGKILKKTN